MAAFEPIAEQSASILTQLQRFEMQMGTTCFSGFRARPVDRASAPGRLRKRAASPCPASFSYFPLAVESIHLEMQVPGNGLEPLTCGL
jgi:hypothetical protein